MYHAFHTRSFYKEVIEMLYIILSDLEQYQPASFKKGILIQEILSEPTNRKG